MSVHSHRSGVLSKLTVVRQGGLGFSYRIFKIFDAISDFAILIVTFLTISLLGIALLFAFTHPVFFQLGLAAGATPSSFISEDFVKDFETANLQTVRNIAWPISLVFLFIFTKQWITFPTTWMRYLLLLTIAVPFFVLLGNLAGVLDRNIFPFSNLIESGQQGFDRSTTPAASALSYSTHVVLPFLTGIYALALLPLGIAALIFSAAIGLRKHRLQTGTTYLGLKSVLSFVRSLPGAFLRRLDPSVLAHILWLVVIESCINFALLFQFLPEGTAVEIRAISYLLTEILNVTDVDKHHLFVGLYFGIARQLFLVVLLVLLTRALLRRAFSDILLAAYFVVVPAFVNYLLLHAGNADQTGTALYILNILAFGLGFAFLIRPHVLGLVRYLYESLSFAWLQGVKRARQAQTPIAFLRPFAMDRINIRSSLPFVTRAFALQGRTNRLETAIADVGFRLAPLMALGDPKVAKPDLGSIRDYTSNASWKGHITKLLGTSRCILFLVGTTESTRWEVDELLKQKLVAKSIFILSPNLSHSIDFFKLNPALLSAVGFPSTELNAVPLNKVLVLWRDRDGILKVVRGFGYAEIDYKLALNFALSSFCRAASA